MSHGRERAAETGARHLQTPRTRTDEPDGEPMKEPMKRARRKRGGNKKTAEHRGGRDGANAVALSQSRSATMSEKWEAGWPGRLSGGAQIGN